MPKTKAPTISKLNEFVKRLMKQTTPPIAPTKKVFAKASILEYFFCK